MRKKRLFRSSTEKGKKTRNNPDTIIENRQSGTSQQERTLSKLPDKYDPKIYRVLTPIEKIKMAINNIIDFDHSLRPLNVDGYPGGLVEFPKTEKREFIVVGDLHANKKNLKAILQDSKNLYKLRDNKTVMVFLGDIVHDERTGHLDEMESSIEILDIVIHLINKFPQNIVYLLGNHDTLDPRLSKSGIQQGLLFHRALIEHRGEKYAELVNKLFRLLPVFVKHPYFLAVHAGPVRGGIGRMELIDIEHYPESKHQLIWNRINETHSTPSMKEYSPEDLDALRKALHCPLNIPIFVGHNPMWKWGGNDSVWVNPLRTHDYVILYSGAEKICPYISVQDSFNYKIKYANLKLKKRRFVLDDY